MKMRIVCFASALAFGQFCFAVPEVPKQDQETNRPQAQILKIVSCAQDLVDFKINGIDGLSFASHVLNDMVLQKVASEQLSSACDHYLKSHKKVNLSREAQLQALRLLKSDLQPHVYFFLRGVIRPLIACVRYSSRVGRLYRKCKSATGKRWYETVVHGEEANQTIAYRIGHSDLFMGLVVVGPQDYFSDEDQDYILSLPNEFSGSSINNLPRELTNKYLVIKNFPLSRTTEFMKHYFIE